VLVVDDEEAVGNTLRLVLQSEHDVDVAISAEAALARIANVDYDAIVCDLMMPVMTGIDLYEAVRRSYPGSEDRMIFMTGGTLIPQSREFLAKLQNPLIAKPFDTDLLRTTLRRLVHLPKSSRPPGAT
jgi:CheY-like chemotaxis protein